MTPKLTDYICNEHALFDLKTSTKTEVLREIAEFAYREGLVRDSEEMFQELQKREDLISTGIGGGVAIPHARCAGVDKAFVVFARSSQGIDFDALDGEPTHIFVTIIGPNGNDTDQLKILSRTARLLKKAEFRERMMRAESAGELLEYIRQEESWW